MLTESQNNRLLRLIGKLTKICEDEFPNAVGDFESEITRAVVNAAITAGLLGEGDVEYELPRRPGR